MTTIPRAPRAPRARAASPALPSLTSLTPLASMPLAAALFAAACTGAGEPAPATTTTAAPIWNGTPVSASARPAAVFIELALPQASVSCTGTLIAPDLVLTAGHCTRCASSALVRILGEHPAAPIGTVASLPFRVAAVGGISTHPAAFTESVSCNQAVDPLIAELGKKVDPGADLGLIRLSTASAITPAKVLLSPPTGFSPLQELFGAQVAIVGRGHPSPDSTQTSVMRQGFHDLYSFQPRKNTCEEPSSTRFAIGALHVGDEAMIQSGDSGGPMFASVPGQGERVIGVASGDTLNLFSYHAPTFTFGNAAFISQAMTGSFWATDGDGDDVIDSSDNCPLDANTDQLDRDGDGRGDVCDNCTPRDPATGWLYDLTGYDGPVAGAASLGNWSQDNTNQEAEDRQILSAMPGLVTADGTVRHITNTDYRSALGDDEACRAGALGAIVRLRRGDRCDVIPAAPASMTYSPLPSTDFVGGNILPCAVTGYAIGTCSYEMSGGWKLKGVLAGSTTTSKVGLRHCRCDLPHATPAERRLHCAGGPYQCAIDPALYQLDHPRWKKLDLDGADASGEKLLSVNLPGGTATVGWDALADLVGATGGTLPPKPWSIDEDGDLVGGPALHGVVWSHVVQMGSTAIGDRADDETRNFAAIASTYGDGDVRFSRVVHWKKIPRYKPAYWWEYCAMCRVNPAQKWLEVVNDPAGQPAWVIAVGPDGGTEVSGAVDATARALLARSDAFHVNASEPEALLRSAGAAHRALVVQSGAFSVLGALGPAGDKIAGESFTGAGSKSLAAATGAGGKSLAATAAPLAAPISIAAGDPVAWAYSATLGALFAVHQDATGRVLLRRFDERTRLWSAVSPYGVSPSTPRAAVYSPDDGSLYVLDRGDAAAIRLLRIDLRDGRTSAVSTRLLEGNYSSLGLALVAPDEASLPGVTPVRLLISAADAGARATRLARLQLPLGRTPLWQLDTAAHPGEEMAGAALPMPDGSALFLVGLTGASAGFEARELAASRFTPVNAAVTKPLF